MNTFLKLVAGHAIMDYWAQSDALAKMKNRNRDASQFCPPGQKPKPVWPYALTAHAIMHGVAVGYVTGSMKLAILESVAHWIIDFGKCENWYGMAEDQLMHIGCKIAWVLVP